MDSPEERLLRLIRKKNKNKSGAEQQALPAALKADAVAAGRRMDLRDLFKMLIPGRRGGEALLLRKINIYLAAVLAVAAGYFTYVIVTPFPYKPALPSHPESGMRRPVQPPLSDYQVYAENAAGKNIFGRAADNAAATDIIQDADISKKFSLVGIIDGENPQAIVEDIESKKTYYVSKGQSFNGAIVEDIADDRIALNYKGSRVILTL